jgi:hydroxymethylglutaryl-CoA lyase
MSSAASVRTGAGERAGSSALDPVRLVEVGPRDGLQNEAVQVSLATKRELIERLAGAGLREIEAGAFVSPKWVPQMADTRPLMEALQALRQPPGPLAGVRLPVLTPNLQGYEAAIGAGADRVAVFAAASETFSRRNINCSIRESLQRFEPVLAAARAASIPVRGYLSCVVGCPYEGAVAPAAVAELARELLAMGCYEISLGDTIGVGTPGSVLRMLEAVAGALPVGRLAGHFHDTYGMAVANAYAAYGFGVRCFDASVAGLGGCPYAPGASGNVATEDLVYLFHGLGVDTGVDLDALVGVGAWICGQLGRESRSRVAQSLGARRGAV